MVDENSSGESFCMTAGLVHYLTKQYGNLNTLKLELPYDPARATHGYTAEGHEVKKTKNTSAL